MCKFLIPLSGGKGGKMSASDKKDLPVFLTDGPAEVKKKINSSFSGSKGDGTLEQHR